MVNFCKKSEINVIFAKQKLVMNKEILEKIELLEDKIRKLINQNFELSQKISNFEKKLKEKEEDLQAINFQFNDLKLDYEKLKIAKSFVAGSDKNNDEAKKKIEKLIKEINICIADLKD